MVAGAPIDGGYMLFRLKTALIKCSERKPSVLSLIIGSPITQHWAASALSVNGRTRPQDCPSDNFMMLGAACLMALLA